MMDFLKKIYFEINYLLKKLRFPKPIILMYHRVADDIDDPHLLCVSPENFRQHIKYLKQTKKIIPLKDIANPNIAKNSVVITFDDGYLDNLQNALPILEEFNAPATVFVTTGLLGKKFPWDTQTSSGKCLNEAELKELSKNSLIEIGSHTMTHPHLKELTVIEKKVEIESSKRILEEIIGKPILSFAYPFGDFDDESINLVKMAGFKQACAVRAEGINKKSDPFLLPRFIVRNWNIKKFIKKMGIF